MDVFHNPRIPQCVRPDADADMLRRLEEYRLDLNAPRHLPETALPLLLEKGRGLAAQEPRKFEETAQAIMNVARHMHPYDAQRFMRERVSNETFDFQCHFDELRKKSPVSLSGLCGVQVASRARFEGVRQAEIAPLSKRFKDTGNRGSFEQDCLSLVSGRVDALSQYLVGEALLRKPIEIAQPAWLESERNFSRINLAETWACEPTQQRFAEKFALVILSGSALPPVDEFLDIESPARMVRDAVDKIQLTEATKVGIEFMPHTVLLPDQVAQMKRESVSALRELKAQNRHDGTTHFPEQYVVAVHAELVMKYRLLKVFDSLTMDSGR